MIRGIGGDPEGSSLAIPSIAKEGGDLPPTPPTTGRNSLRSIFVKLVAWMFWTHLLASRSSPQPRLSPCWGPILRFSCRSPSMPWRYHINERSYVLDSMITENCLMHKFSKTSNLRHVPVMPWRWTLGFTGWHRHSTDYLWQYVHLRNSNSIKIGFMGDERAHLVREDVKKESAESNLNLINRSWKTKLE